MVGKTAICTRFANDRYHDVYEPTYENSFSKTFHRNGQEIDFIIKDTQGLNDQEIFRNEYGLGYHGYILVYSISSKRSLEVLEGINRKLLNLTGTSKVPRVLVANKADIAQRRKVSSAEGHALAARCGCSFVECSAKFNHNIDLIFETLLDEIQRVAEEPFANQRCLDMFKEWLLEPHGRYDTNYGETILQMLILGTMTSGFASLALGIDAIARQSFWMIPTEDTQLLAYVLLGFGLSISLVSGLGMWGLRLKNREFLSVYCAAVAVVLTTELAVSAILTSKMAVLYEIPWYMIIALSLVFLVQCLSMTSAYFYEQLVDNLDDWNPWDSYADIPG